MATFEKKIDRARNGASRHPRAVGECRGGVETNFKGLLCLFYQGHIQKSFCSVENKTQIQKVLKSAI